MSDNRQVNAEYIARINLAMDYLEAHLDQPLTLAHIADVAGFSRFHFHRIFAAATGETLFDCIQRLRLEKSASQLVLNPDVPVTEIALLCGFSSSSAFARGFRARFGISATAWRKQTQTTDLYGKTGCPEDGYRNLGQTNRNLSQVKSKMGKEWDEASRYSGYARQNQTWRLTMNQTAPVVEVKELPEMTLAYVRYTGPYKGDTELFDRLYERLYRFAGPRGLVNPQAQSITVYHDSPEITAENQLRVSVGITVPPDTEVSGEVGKMTLPGGKYALARFELDKDGFSEAWGWVYGEWLPNSGYTADDRLGFEWYHNTPEDNAAGRFILDICIPVKVL